MKLIISGIVIVFAVFSPGVAQSAETDKTLVAWFAPADLTHRGGSALTIQSGDEFDGIVFGEIQPGKWMAGSDRYKRTERAQDNYVPETAEPSPKALFIDKQPDRKTPKAVCDLRV